MKFLRCVSQSRGIKQTRKIDFKKTRYRCDEKLIMIYLSISKCVMFDFTHVV